MKSVIIDSSSAILLYRCNIFPALLNYCRVIIPEAVFSELTIPGYSGAAMFTDLCSIGRIKVYQESIQSNEERTGSLHPGERAVIALFYESAGDFIIIDDGQGGAFCRDNSIPYINALLAVKIMFMKNLISDTEYAAAWRWLLDNGRYSEKIISWADNADANKLTLFM